MGLSAVLCVLTAVGVSLSGVLSDAVATTSHGGAPFSAEPSAQGGTSA